MATLPYQYEMQADVTVEPEYIARLQAHGLYPPYKLLSTNNPQDEIAYDVISCYRQCPVEMVQMLPVLIVVTIDDIFEYTLSNVHHE